MFKEDNLKVMQAMLERITLQEQELLIQLEMQRVKDSEWFKDKMLLAQAQEARVVLNDEQHDAYDSDYDDKDTTNAIFMANLSHVGSINDDIVEQCYDSDILSQIPHYDTYHDTDMLNLSVVQIVLWYLDSGCSKHMTRDRSQLTNFVHKFLGTVKFGNEQVAKIIG
nr:integrase, catalytic region, zinc finger, CCHC-type, peptidase aspartic, catalytic [Tanacetum cinerariifolium]